jgi:hypothetical protein
MVDLALLMCMLIVLDKFGKSAAAVALMWVLLMRGSRGGGVEGEMGA